MRKFWLSDSLTEPKKSSLLDPASVAQGVFLALPVLPDGGPLVETQFEPRQHLWRPWLPKTAAALDKSVAGSLMPLEI